MFVTGILRPIPLTRLIYKNDTSTFDLIHFTNVVYFSSTTIQDDEANYELSIAHKSKVKRRESTSLRSPIVGYTASNMTCRTCLKKVVCNVATEYRMLDICCRVQELRVFICCWRSVHFNLGCSCSLLPATLFSINVPLFPR